MNISDLLASEELRRKHFPIADHQAFLAHAGVAALPLAAAKAVRDFADQGSRAQQERDFFKRVNHARATSARLLGADSDEIALLGPTALGLNLVADGLDWREGDEVVCYQDDYPANVYPWLKLADRGVRCALLETADGEQGRITWETVENALTERTRLVALATANFASGTRIDVDAIGEKLHERGILFCLDGIQTLGAFPLRVTHVDFLSADSHKWLLGPVGAGIFYVKKKHHDVLRPSLLGAWNVVSPEFVAQRKIEFYAGARRYECGTLNLPGIAGMAASMELLLTVGVENIAARLLALKDYLAPRLTEIGFKIFGAQNLTVSEMSGISSFLPPAQGRVNELASLLAARKIAVSIRQDRAGRKLLRVSPHFYNTKAELDQLAAVCAEWAKKGT
ncbi:MAG: aminotransferase class V-fold PLP-dependent enzyme [Verrucomicrobiales bacterium]|jgi:selenocysteine lyase/cysteine desulfurase|nr:aminotransferase class V-fold PLP-dependent enzyme [Verrucomicrobiales bacterium]